jgi:hypothetical protein
MIRCGNRGNRMAATTLSLLVGLAACGRPDAMGDMNVVIVGVPDAEWPALEAEVHRYLEPRVFVGQDERIFRVTQVDPTGPFWPETRLLRNVIVVGEAEDEWVADALRRAPGQPDALPAVSEARNVWARGQQVYALVVPPGSSAAAAQPLLPGLGESMLGRYHQFLRQRMYASGVAEERTAAIEEEAQFRLVTPAVYRLERFDPVTYRYLNDQPDPARLQRSVLVTWRPSGEVVSSEEGVLQWREEIAQSYYDPAQLTMRDRIESAPVGEATAPNLEVRGQWASVPGAWPAGGPFVTRLVPCPDGRTFLLDGWVYAPGREKYEYVMQLTQILDSFGCVPQPAS